MKKWHMYLMIIWTPVVMMTALNVYIWVSMNLDLNPCGYHDATILGHKKGKIDVLLRRSFCDRGCVEKIVFRKWLSDSEIFVYEPIEGCPKPAMTWLGQEHLEIIMSEVSHIYTERTEVRGIKITYRIGKVDDPYPR